jgi:hypothetical protein
MLTRRRNVTEQAATAAIEQGCRMLRLPTIRDRFAEIATAAEREQMTSSNRRRLRPARSHRAGQGHPDAALRY